MLGVVPWQECNSLCRIAEDRACESVHKLLLPLSGQWAGRRGGVQLTLNEHSEQSWDFKHVFYRGDLGIALLLPPN